MKFSTPIPLTPAESPFNYKNKILLLGSCFSDNIGTRLQYYKFQVLSNPFGILFNPIAIKNLIVRAVKQHYFTKKDLFYVNERWHCFQVHSQCSNADATIMLEKLNASLEDLNDFLRTASHIFITAGTAWVYEYRKTGETVANCHKVPQTEFSKQLLTVEEIKESLAVITREIHKVNTNVQFIYTVSPVRHLKEGFTQNQRSKAHLIAAVHQRLMSGKEIHYFPAYEILMDELRDYRFYAADMIHPSETAISYIWKQFSDVWIAEEARPVMKTVAAIRSGLAHRPFNSNSEAHRAFMKNLQEKIKQLQVTHPFIQFNNT
jgi:lysophospholipase L1-like esterase